MNWNSPNTPQSEKTIGGADEDAVKTAGKILGAISLVLFIIIALVFCTKQGTDNSGTSISTPKKEIPIVHNSEYDKSVRQVSEWLKENLKDPKSLEIINWGYVWETEMFIGDAYSNLSIPVFKVTVKYRAKNSFGGYVVESKQFTLDKTGKVINVEDY